MPISQIFLSDADNQELSPFLRHATSTVQGAFPNEEHTIYNKETLRQFIADNYDLDILWAYDSLRPYSYKADLGRFCLLNKLGGWYFDIAVRAAHQPVTVGSRVEFLAFRDIQRFSYTSWACATTVLYSKPSNPSLVTAIQMIVKNCHEQYYGITPLCPTGPTLLGAALAANGGNANHVFGDYLELTPTHEQKNRAFILPDGTIMAWSKPSGGGDLAGVGAKGVNNYNTLWHARSVYATV
jgi:mannosyltransferase OCH1-like enzyme